RGGRFRAADGHGREHAGRRRPLPRPVGAVQGRSVRLRPARALGPSAHPSHRDERGRRRPAHRRCLERRRGRVRRRSGDDRCRRGRCRRGRCRRADHRRGNRRRARDDERGRGGRARRIDDEILAGIEAVLMITDSAVSAEELAGSLGLDEDTVLEAITTLKADYDGDEDRRQRGFEIRHVAGGFRIFSRGDYHEVVKDFLTAGQSAKLSQAALETLAVIAYRQPISRPRIAAIRGVSIDGVIRTLLLRGLIVEAGKEASTSALLYATTPQFLDTMGMNTIDDLPDIAPYLPEDADVAELGAEDTEVLAEIDDLDSEDDPAAGPGVLEANAGDGSGVLEAGAGDDSGVLEAGAGDDTGGEVGDQSAEMSRVDD